MSTRQPEGNETPAISAIGVSRRFGPTQALDGVDLNVRNGEVLAILGENGAGKTTLMRILAGLDHPTSGTLYRQDRPYAPKSPRHAVAEGVTLVQQHFALVPTMTAAENVLLFRSQHGRRTTRERAAVELTELAASLNFEIDPRKRVDELSVGQRQRLELLRALDSDPDVLLLDEPTAVLTDAEADSLLEVVKQLAHADNRAIVLITHRMREVIHGADRVLVMREGRVVAPPAPVGARTAAELAAQMVGHEIIDVRAGRKSIGDLLLEAKGIEAPRLGPIDFSIRRGEVLGIAGVDGNGQMELEMVLTGSTLPSQGELSLEGRSIGSLHPRKRIAERIAYIPGDRDLRALVGPMRCDENLLLGRTAGFTRRHPEAAERMRKWSVKGMPGAAARDLSGGNAQKLVAAREMEGEPDVVLAFQPTRGLDPNAAIYLRQSLVDRATQGSAVLWVSANLDELVEVADRILVMFSGRVVGEFTPPFARAEIGLAMAGVG